MNRQEQIKHLQTTKEFDICVIGAGATGAGIALDAALRGLKVVLIDKNDFAGQTSSKSTKLIHGGVRYLEQAVKKLDWEQFKMVRKSLRERETLLNNAPHLTRPLALITPCFNFFEGIYYTIGMKMYEWISGSQSIAKSQWLSKKETLDLIPELKAKRLSSGVLYYDGQLDDARYCLAIIQSAEAKGAVVLNHTQALKFSKNEDNGRLKSLNIKDLISGEESVINAKVFINATGPFADSIRAMANTKLKPRIKVSRGAHVILPREVMKGDTAILVPKTDDGRVVFMIPWQDQVLVGTTDEADELSENPKLEEYERTYLLEYVNRYFEKTVTLDQIKSGFAGLRPLLQAQLQTAMNSDTKSIVRDHEVEIDRRSKLVSIMGGKWTTYRLMAKDTLDTIYAEVLKKDLVKCTSEHQVLHGGENYNFEDWQNLVQDYGVSEWTAKHLMKKYGNNAQKVLQLTDSQTDLKNLLSPNHPFIKAEVVYAVQEEMAITIDDVLERRLGLKLRDELASKASESYVEEILGVRMSKI
jgi:glycerol-3-phosphate dehydrogenase